MNRPAPDYKELLANILKGMATPADVYRVNRYRYPHNAELNALRGDWERVGNDFKTVIDREHGKAASS